MFQPNFIIPVYSRIHPLEPTNYIQQMSDALQDIRFNCRDGANFAQRRMDIATDLLNIPARIRLDDNFGTTCPPELRAVFLDILYKTFKKIKENSGDGMLCRLLADHAHNIPHCIIKRADGTPMRDWSLRYYWVCERPIILHGLHGGNTTMTDYGPAWYRDLFNEEWEVIGNSLREELTPMAAELINSYGSANYCGLNPLKAFILRGNINMNMTGGINAEQDGNKSNAKPDGAAEEVAEEVAVEDMAANQEVADDGVAGAEVEETKVKFYIWSGNEDDENEKKPPQDMEVDGEDGHNVDAESCGDGDDKKPAHKKEAEVEECDHEMQTDTIKKNNVDKGKGGWKKGFLL
eukprot:scaffold98479_cov50-Cyclotella_meneghiniana.AAC.2